tara:strand:- start:975 stop:1364 length:390 start_codon:yes stop_codon:yes gene_type:complete
MVEQSKIIERIKRIISDSGLSNSSFADKIGVPRSSISHILSGRNNPSLDLIIKILRNFDDINADFLLKGEVLPPMDKDSKKDLDNKNMTLFPELDIKEDTKERPKIDEEVLKSVILVYQNDKFEILKKK